MFGRSLFLLVFLLISARVHAQPAGHPEDAVVYIEVSVERRDPTSNQPTITKVGEGTGFIVNSGGWVVTARHVIDVEATPTSKLVLSGSVRSRHASKFPLEPVSAVNMSSDVTLLRFPPGLGVVFPYLCVVKTPKIELRRKLVTLGFPLGLDLSVRPGEITSISGPNNLVQTNAGLARGMSGGPVIDDQGVVGVIHGGIDGQNSFDFFTPSNLARALFEVPPAAFVGETCRGSSSNGTPAQIIERSYQISETYDDHPTIAATTRQYAIRKQADPGHSIVDARLVRESDTRVSDLAINVSPDRQSVELAFKLTAGPAFDRYRGWLHGQLILRMRPQ